MIPHARKFLHIAPALAFMLSGADAIAGMGGGTIVYRPVPQSIPTLSGSMLKVLGTTTAVYRTIDSAEQQPLLYKFHWSAGIIGHGK
ncbi:MAG: hypothetical protein NTV37_07460 [Proteobacteria bacterium]|nr:hypothetical protein [Pseudomonadota bacterium]